MGALAFNNENFYCCFHAFNGLNFYRFALKNEMRAMKKFANDMKKINAGFFMGALPYPLVRAHSHRSF